MSDFALNLAVGLALAAGLVGALYVIIKELDRKV